MTLCDAHIHIVGDPDRYPMIANRSYTPGPAEAKTIERLGAPLGVGRFVVVQPSFYGTDNTVLLDALQAFGDNGRGVAVVDPDRVTEAELDRLATAGVMGLRVNLYSTHGAAPSNGAAAQGAGAMAIAARMGWHLQVIAHLPVLAEAEAVFADSPVPVVIDHYGLPDRGDPDGQAAQLTFPRKNGHRL